jgi:predicted amidohydrolase YtcJ
MEIEVFGAGTDFPVKPINIYIMVARKGPNGNVCGASEAVSREPALRLHTSAAARYIEEGRKRPPTEAALLRRPPALCE